MFYQPFSLIDLTCGLRIIITSTNSPARQCRIVCLKGHGLFGLPTKQDDHMYGNAGSAAGVTSYADYLIVRPSNSVHMYEGTKEEEEKIQSHEWNR